MNKENCFIVSRHIKRGSYARMLADGLGIGAKTKAPYRKDDFIINWGRSVVDGLRDTQIIFNKPNAVSSSVNKLISLDLLNDHNVPVPKYTTGLNQALEWISEGFKVYCRTMLRSSRGEGIVIASNVGELVNAPLYTRRFPNHREYRVHVLPDGSTIMQRKSRRTASNLEAMGLSHDAAIRNISNGYVFTTNNFDPFDYNVEEELIDIAVKAVKALGLDFGAVDLGVTKHTQRIVVFEVNTAPALVGNTLDRYVSVFKELIENFGGVSI